jgi:hypothetical protein
MIRTINCKCGNNVQLDYGSASILMENEGLKPVYYFKCNQCGQTYSKDVPSTIQIDEETIS